MSDLNSELLIFDGIDYNEEVLRDIDFESGLSEFYDSIKNDVEECEEEEIAQKVLTGVLKDAVAKQETSLNSTSISQHISTLSPTFTPSNAITLVPSTSTFSATKALNSMPKQLSPSLIWKLELMESSYQKYVFKFDDVRDFVYIDDKDFLSKWVTKMEDKPWVGTVELMKSFDGFQQLNQDDQVILAKAAVGEFSCIFNAINADVDGKKFVFEDKRNQKVLIDIDLVHQRMGMGQNDMVRRHRERYTRVVRCCLPEWRQNRKLMLLLCGIALFNPDRQRLRDRCLVWKIQEFFYDLLRQYLAVLYPREADARLAFVGIISFLAGFRELTKVSLKDFYSADIPFVRRWIDQHSSQFMRELTGFSEC